MAPKMSTLGERFRQVTQTATEDKDYESVSFEELGKWQITFGEAKVGQTFEKVVKEDPKYVIWFSNTYGPRPNKKHLPFLHYVQQYVDLSEKHLGQAKSKAMAKAKTASAPDTALPPSESEEEEMIEPSWSVVMKQSEQDSRLERLEHSVALMMQQVGEMTRLLSGANQINQ